MIDDQGHVVDVFSQHLPRKQHLYTLVKHYYKHATAGDYKGMISDILCVYESLWVNTPLCNAPDSRGLVHVQYIQCNQYCVRLDFYLKGFMCTFLAHCSVHVNVYKDSICESDPPFRDHLLLYCV